MFDTTVSVSRQGATVAKGIRVQVDQASLKEVAEHAQVEGHQVADLFKLYTLSWPVVLIQRGDRLFDEIYIDPQTGRAYIYLVVGRVKLFRMDHLECYAQVAPGQ